MTVIALGSLAYLVVLILSTYIVIVRRNRSLSCAACGYSLVDLPLSLPCPECGTRQGLRRHYVMIILKCRYIQLLTSGWIILSLLVVIHRMRSDPAEFLPLFAVEYFSSQRSGNYKSLLSQPDAKIESELSAYSQYECLLFACYCRHRIEDGTADDSERLQIIKYMPFLGSQSAVCADSLLKVAADKSEETLCRVYALNMIGVLFSRHASPECIDMLINCCYEEESSIRMDALVVLFSLDRAAYLACLLDCLRSGERPRVLDGLRVVHGCVTDDADVIACVSDLITTDDPQIANTASVVAGKLQQWKHSGD